MLRRFMSSMLLAGLVGLALCPPGSEAWAEGRARATRAKGKGGRKVSPKATPKVDTSTKAEPASSRLTDPVSGEPAATATPGTPPTRGPARIDFDDRLIQGQTNKSGAVYLYDRKELKTRSMIRERDSFRSEILSTVYDQP